MDADASQLQNALLGDLDPESLLELVPELMPTVECRQNHPGHNLDVFAHTIKVVEQLPLDFTLRLAALLHDIGKPEAKVKGEDGYDHFKGHEEIGVQKANIILERFNVPYEQKKIVCQLVKLHDTPIALTKNEMKLAIQLHGLDFITKLLVLQHADLLAHASEYYIKKLPRWEEMNQWSVTVVTEE